MHEALSGVASCPSDKLLSKDGTNQSVTSDQATDPAGNESDGKLISGINIDVCGSRPSSWKHRLATWACEDLRE